WREVYKPITGEYTDRQCGEKERQTMGRGGQKVTGERKTEGHWGKKDRLTLGREGSSDGQWGE
ncbi:hypothetical protein ACQP3L_27505, partial [Escherichia coli]